MNCVPGNMGRRFTFSLGLDITRNYWHRGWYWFILRICSQMVYPKRCVCHLSFGLFMMLIILDRRCWIFRCVGRGICCNHAILKGTGRLLGQFKWHDAHTMSWLFWIVPDSKYAQRGRGLFYGRFTFCFLARTSGSRGWYSKCNQVAFIMLVNPTLARSSTNFVLI